MNKKWTDFRAEQLSELNMLLVEAKSIDHGSNVTFRIKRCERIATALTSMDPDTPQESFIQFLTRLCIEDRTNISTK
jgi:hypothetical protein